MFSSALILAQVKLADSNDMFADNLQQLAGRLDTYESAAFGVLTTLLVIEFAWLGVRFLVGAEEKILAPIVTKLFAGAIIAFLTLNWGGIAGEIKGYISGGQQSSSNPALIAQQGINKVAFIFSDEGIQKAGESLYDQRRNDRGESGSNGTSLNPFSEDSVFTEVGEAGEDLVLAMITLLILTTLALAIVLCYFYVAAMVYVVSIEFYIIVTLTSCFVPFGVNKHTSFVMNSAFNGVIASSVKLATLLLLVELSNPLMASMVMSPTASIKELLSMLLAGIMYAFVVSKAPSVAGQAFSGAGGGVDVAGSMGAATAAVASTAGALATKAGLGAAAVGAKAGGAAAKGTGNLVKSGASALYGKLTGGGGGTKAGSTGGGGKAGSAGSKKGSVPTPSSGQSDSSPQKKAGSAKKKDE